MLMRWRATLVWCCGRRFWVRRFEQFRDQLGVAENVLSKRLSTMMDAGTAATRAVSGLATYPARVRLDRGWC